MLSKVETRRTCYGSYRFLFLLKGEFWIPLQTVAHTAMVIDIRTRPCNCEKLATAAVALI